MTSAERWPEMLSDATVRNADVAWDRWPVQQYLTENYRELHPCDAEVIDHHSAFYRRLAPDSVERSLEFGAGPNLYPLMLTAACSRELHAVEPSAANVAYLRRQLTAGLDASWLPFYERCRTGNDALPESPEDALARVRVVYADGMTVAPGGYDLTSMHFVAEGATEDPAEFAAFCRTFVHAARPGGHVIAAFMENLGRYRLGDGPQWPAFPVDVDTVRTVFAPFTEDLEVTRIDADPTLPDYGDTGMILLTARRRPARAPRATPAGRRPGGNG